MYVCMYVCMHVCMYVCMYVRTYVCIYVCMHACIYMHIYVHLYACTYVRMYSFICICILIYVRIFVYTFLFSVESKHPDKHRQAQWLLSSLLTHQHRLQQLERAPHTFRIGLSGPPGAGKSTFIETFGQMITKEGNKLAVLVSNALTRDPQLGNQDSTFKFQGLIRD